MALVPFHVPHFTAGDRAAADAVLDSRFTTMGVQVGAFEEAFAGNHGRAYAVMVNSCTNGHMLVFQYLRRVVGLAEGTQAIFPATTFAGPAFQAAHAGFTVEFADTDPETGATPGAALLAHAPSGPAVLAPLGYGGIALHDMAALLKGARDGQYVVEDCAHATGARDADGALIGGLPTYASIFSFYPTKIVNATEGGMILTDDANLAAWCRMARLHGIGKDASMRYRLIDVDWDYALPVMGFKCNPTNIQAAIGLSQLARLEGTLVTLKEIAEVYLRAAAEAGLQALSGQITGNQHLFVLRDTPREALLAHLKAHDVHFSVHYPRLWRVETWGKREWALPGAERFGAGCVSLPIYADLTAAQVNQVAGAVRSFMS